MLLILLIRSKMDALKMSHMIAIFLVLFLSVNSVLIGLVKVNLLEKLFGKNSVFPKVIYGLVGISAVVLLFSRDTYLPFLGQSVMPCSGLAEQIPVDADTEITVKVQPGAKVVYWASEPEDKTSEHGSISNHARAEDVDNKSTRRGFISASASEELKTLPTWKSAYAAYKNLGVTVSNEEGIAILAVRNPQAYTVPLFGRIAPHIHYRVCSNSGMMSRLETVYIN